MNVRTRSRLAAALVSTSEATASAVAATARMPAKSMSSMR